MKKFKLILQKLSLTKILIIFLFVILLATYVRIFAIGTPYNPGQTLNPTCPPGEINCTVNIEGFDGTQVITRSSLPGVGTAVGGTTTREFLQNYFFPAVAPSPSISIAGGNSLEFGYSTPLSISWTATKGTYNISAISLSANAGGAYSSGTPITATGNTQSGSATGTYLSNTSTTYTLNTTPATGSLVSSGITISFYNRKYYGVSTTATGITDGEIIALANKPFATSRATGSLTSQIDFGSSPGNYVYFAWPASFEGGSPICHSTGPAPTYTVTSGTTTNCFNSGSNPVTSFILEQRSFVNASGYSVLYNIYRSKNPVGGSYWVQ